MASKTYSITKKLVFTRTQNAFFKKKSNRFSPKERAQPWWCFLAVYQGELREDFGLGISLLMACYSKWLIKPKNEKKPHLQKVYDRHLFSKNDCLIIYRWDGNDEEETFTKFNGHWKIMAPSRFIFGARIIDDATAVYAFIIPYAGRGWMETNTASKNHLDIRIYCGKSA